jgi:hypothetical protein
MNRCVIFLVPFPMDYHKVFFQKVDECEASALLKNLGWHEKKCLSFQQNLIMKDSVKKRTSIQIRCTTDV